MKINIFRGDLTGVSAKKKKTTGLDALRFAPASLCCCCGGLPPSCQLAWWCRWGTWQMHSSAAVTKKSSRNFIKGTLDTTSSKVYKTWIERVANMHATCIKLAFNVWWIQVHEIWIKRVLDNWILRSLCCKTKQKTIQATQLMFDISIYRIQSSPHQRVSGFVFKITQIVSGKRRFCDFAK